MKMSEGIDIVSTSTKRSLIAQVGGGGGMLQFPVSPDASNAIDAFVAGNSNLVVLSIDVKAEIVNLNLLDTLANLDQRKKKEGFFC